MKTYVGTKIIKAQPMTRQEYNDYRGWQSPADEEGTDEGYLVEYVDGGESNHPNHNGYISWSPKDVFERAYVDMDLSAAEFDELPPHVQRVYAEIHQLDERENRLVDFGGTKAFQELSYEQKALLNIQGCVMGAYGEILSLRLNVD